MPFWPQPSWIAICFASQSLSEPTLDTAISLPLKSATVLIGDSAKTIAEMLRGGPAKAATPIDAPPFAEKAMPGPLPRPKSTLPAASACCTLASPPRSELSTARPCLAKKPCAVPISTGRKVQAVPCALPTRTISAATASVPAKAAASAISAAIIVFFRIDPPDCCGATRPVPWHAGIIALFPARTQATQQKDNVRRCWSANDKFPQLRGHPCDRACPGRMPGSRASAAAAAPAAARRDGRSRLCVLVQARTRHDAHRNRRALRWRWLDRRQPHLAAQLGGARHQSREWPLGGHPNQ